MGNTRNGTVTGYFLRRRLKRHIVLRVWDMVRDVIMGRELARVWQPTRPCRCCQSAVEERAVFCSIRGTPQQPLQVPVSRSGPGGQARRAQETEALPVTPLPLAIPETEKLARLTAADVETKRLYNVRIGELRPIHQYLAEKRRKEFAELGCELARAEALIAEAAQVPELDRHSLGHLQETTAWIRAVEKEESANGIATNDTGARYSEHKAGETIRFRQGNGEKTGTILYVRAPGATIAGGAVHPTLYVVDCGEGFLTRVAPGEVVEK